MRSVLVGLVAVTAASAQAAPAPDMVGKSVLVTWTEAREQRIDGSPLRSVSVGFRLGVYVSSAGRPFTRLTSVGQRGNVNTNDQVGGTGDSLGGGVRSVRVDGRTLTLQATFGNFGRSLRVEVAPGGSSCTARMSVGKQVGSAPTAYRNVSGRTIELHSVSVSGTSCQIQDGNVFAR